jgi:cysteinyl-tRNA synthetase
MAMTGRGSLPWASGFSEAPPPPSPAESDAAGRRLGAARGNLETALVIGGRRLPVLGRASCYVCGITPYDTTHLGHAATFVWADVAARVIRLAGAQVEVCRNITDVDDHLLVEAKATQVPWRSIATQETYRFARDMVDLGVSRPTFEPRSYDYVGEVISLVAELVSRGLAYPRDGSVYFRGSELHVAAGLEREEAIALARERGGHPDDPNKDDPLDAALWQHSIGDEPAWPSPWGPGRPGWHAECSAMALATLGPSIDLHVGGADLAFPHHAYEAAQAEGYSGVHPFVRAWMHVGTVMIDGQKMAKSTGNLVLVRDLLERWSPGALRLLILSRRWDEAWEFAESDLDRAAGQLDELWSRAAKPAGHGSATAEVDAALLADLDVARALEVANEAGGQVLRDLIALLGLQ